MYVRLHFPPKCRFPQEVQVAGAPPALCLAIPQISRLCPEIVQIDCSHLSAKHQIGLPVRDSSNLLPKNHHKFLFREPEVLGLSRPLSLASGRLVSPKIQKKILKILSLVMDLLLCPKTVNFPLILIFIFMIMLFMFMLITIDLILKIFLLQTRCPTPSQSKWATRSSTYQLSRWVNIKQKLVSNVWWKGSDRCFALPSPVSASSHPLLVLRQQQFASTGISLVILLLVILLLVNLLLVIVHLFLIILLTGGSSGFLLAKSALCGTHALGHRGSRRRCRTVSVHGQEWGFFCLTFSWLFFLCFTSQMEIAINDKDVLEDDYDDDLSIL